MKALVIAGKAIVELDQVRGASLLSIDGKEEINATFWRHEVDNHFKGALGIQVANILAEKGFDTTILLAKDSVNGAELDPQVKVSTFRTFKDLEKSLDRILKEESWNLIFMSAAPPDYQPTKIQGKMRSDAEEITITYQKTPKLLDRFRDLVGYNCLIVGFKLLVGVTPETLDLVGKNQIKRARTDICIGNDFALINKAEGTHPLQIIYPDSEASVFLEGFKKDTVKDMVEIVLNDFKQAHYPFSL